AADQRGQFSQAGAIDLQVEIDPFRGYVPAAAECERTQTLRRTVGSRRHARAVNPPPAATRTGRRNIEVRFGEIEDRLGVAELKVDAPVADMDRRCGTHHRRIHKGRKVPTPPGRAVAGLGEVDADIVLQADGCYHELTAEQRPQARPHLHRLDICHGFDTDGW